jgi:hypothetical protein
MMGKIRLSLALAGTALLAATSGIAQEGQAPQMSAEEKAMMEAYAKAATPGKQHEWLASKAGSWTFTGTFWMDPAKAPTTTSGSVERGMMLGGRVLEEKVTSPGFMGQPFEGYGLTGYDNVTLEYWGMWSDSMGTGMMSVTGKCDDKGVCSQTGEYVDPLTGKKRTTRMTSRDEGPDKEMHESFEKGPDGKEFKTMELVYTRKK